MKYLILLLFIGGCLSTKKQVSNEWIFRGDPYPLPPTATMELVLDSCGNTTIKIDTVKRHKFLFPK